MLVIIQFRTTHDYTTLMYAKVYWHRVRIAHRSRAIIISWKGIRDGVTVCPNRYEDANNKYMSTDYDGNEESYITYFDVNNYV